MLYEAQRHETLTDHDWSSNFAQAHLERILTTTMEYFQSNNKWLSTIAEFYNTPSEQASLFFGAAGILSALKRLKPEYITSSMIDYLDKLENLNTLNLLQLNKLIPCNTDSKGLFLGASGINWVKYQLCGKTKDLEALLENIKNNHDEPALDLIWSMPGTMFLANKIYRQTSSPLALDLFHQQANALWTKLVEVKQNDIYLWQQDLYGSKSTLVGMGHGFAGNLIPYLEGFDLFDKQFQQTIFNTIERTMTNTAIYHDKLVNWPQSYGKPRPGRDAMLMQICHGAPGIIVSLAKCFGQISNDFDKLLLTAGETIWQAGPLTKPSGLCHGTAGNGYALLVLYTHTGDEMWLRRARKFAVHAILQSKYEWDKAGLPYFSLSLGDLGLACFLQDCLQESCDFPIA